MTAETKAGRRTGALKSVPKAAPKATPKATPKTAPKRRPAEISLSRKTAFHILLAVERGASHSDDLLRGKAVSALCIPDRNLATALVLGVLRWQIRLDRQFRALLARPNARLDPEILIALRLGAFQLLHMDRIPARAVLSESVELTKQSGHRFASGMVNAVLRKLAGAPRFDADQESTDEHAWNQDYPAWMVERWTGFYGSEAVRKICRHGQSQPVLAVRLAAPAVEAELVAAGVVLEAGQLLTTARTVVTGDITAMEAFREGRVRLQDEGSQLVAELACANLGQKVKILLDACAAPGGKTLLLAERNPEAHIVALEVSATRMEDLQKRLAFLGDLVECRLADATALTEDAAFDLALADVPCSGTGTLGRNPEIRHRLRPQEFARQAKRQRSILAAALRSVRPGGFAVYSTCSLEPEENEQVLADVLAADATARQVSLEARIDQLLRDGILMPQSAPRLRRSLTPEGALRLFPGNFHTDGFFIALIEKTA
jgi:16S rRNA (cytosine967-C5)-methyltransferase